MAHRPVHYVLITAGTAGDMYPFMSLARALQQLGRKATVMGPAFHAGMVRQAGLPFVELGTDADYLKVVNNPDIWHPSKGLRTLLENYSEQLGQIRSALAALAAQEPCIVIAHPLAMPAAAIVRENTPDMKLVAVYLAPSNLRTCHDPLTIGPLRVPPWVPMAWRGALWRLIEDKMIDPAAVPQVNAARLAAGLAPITSFIAHLASAPDLSVALFPSWFAPPCPDWPQPLRMGDFQLFDPSAGQALPGELTDFLAQGEKPIVFTPGTGHVHAAAYFQSAMKAVTRMGRRAIFLTRCREQIPAVLPETILWQPYVALANLLPQAAALVHHGGIGTTAEALRAGVPQLVVPFAWDQFDNGARVAALGVGSVLPASRLSTRALARKLHNILSSSAMHAQCRAVAAHFKHSDGAARLCREIENALAIAPDETSNPLRVLQDA